MNAASARESGAKARDKRERILITPEGIALPVRVAGRGSRLGALVLDFTFLIVTMIAIYLLVIWLAGELLVASAFGMTTGASEAINIFLILLFFLARYGYFLALELGPRGATWGKLALGIRVAARGGRRLTPEAIVARNLLRDIELFMPVIFLLVAPSGEAGSFGIAGLVWFLTFMAFPFFNKDALRAGDIIAGTWVVEAPRTKLAEAISVQGAARLGASDVTGARYDFGEEELSVYGEHELQVLERMLRENQTEALTAAHATICAKIGWDPGEGDERAFLEAFYAQLRAKLEGDMRFGKRKADKFS